MLRFFLSIYSLFIFNLSYAEVGARKTDHYDFRLSCLSSSTNTELELVGHFTRPKTIPSFEKFNGQAILKFGEKEKTKTSVVGEYFYTGREFQFKFSPIAAQQFDVFRRITIVPWGERGVFLNIEFLDENDRFFTTDIDCK